ncbi:BnaA03g50260D [Brassica napus]|nr:BnaA03g50260D [Brassica napus]
MSAKPEIIQKV